MCQALPTFWPTSWKWEDNRDTIRLRSTKWNKFQAHTTCKHANTRDCQSQMNPARKMSSTYDLRAHQHMRLDQPQINPARNVKHVRAASTPTHETWSASNQPSKGKCQALTAYECTNTWDSVSLRFTQQRKCQARTCCEAQTRNSVSLESSQQGKYQARTVYECIKTWDSVSLRSTQQGKC